MNTKFCRFVLAGLICCFGASCTTAYDAYGYPQQVVDPGVAIAGAAAVGLLAYGLANSNDHRDRGHHRSHYRGYDRGYYGHDDYGSSGYCRPSHYHSYGGHHGYYD